MAFIILLNMSSLDYEHRAKVSLKRFLANPKISKANKELFQKFMASRNVSHARISIYCTHIHYLLENCKDVSLLQNDRDKVNKIFKGISDLPKLRKQLSTKYVF